MAKRFTDSNKFRDPFYRSLPSPYKLLWDFIHHECDHSGIWMVDMEVAQICIGKDLKINTQTALEYFTQDDRMEPIDGGRKWFIRSFILDQYGDLNPANRVHQSVISALKKNNINQDLTRAMLGPSKDLTRTFQGPKDKDKDKEKDKDMEQGGAGGKQYTECMDLYFDFVKRQTGVPPMMNQIEGKAMKEIIKYLNSIDQSKITENFGHILSSYPKWEPFHQKQIKLAQIQTNLINIINTVKNNGKQTTRNITNDDIASALREHHSRKNSQ